MAWQGSAWFGTRKAIQVMARHRSGANRIWGNCLYSYAEYGFVRGNYLLSTLSWQIVSEKEIQGDVEELRSIRLAPEFRHYDESDLLTYATWVACGKAS